MRTPSEIGRDLPAELDEDQRKAQVAVAMRLQAERPPPGASFRGDLRRALFGAPKSQRETTVKSPRTIRLLIASYASSGLLLLAVAAIGLVGAGPFASG